MIQTPALSIKAAKASNQYISGDSIQEFHFQEEGKLSLKELRLPADNFTFVEADLTKPLLQRQILENSNQVRGGLTSALAISVETHQTLSHHPIPSRVVIINELGQIVLDTLIKIEDPSLVLVKPGKKASLRDIANSKGPSAEDVKAKVLEIITGHKIIGYNPKVKLSELGVFHMMALDDITGLVNCSSMFNKDGKTDPQNPMKKLCIDHLNVLYSKRPYPYALIEARICMALYMEKLYKDTHNCPSTSQVEIPLNTNKKSQVEEVKEIIPTACKLSICPSTTEKENQDPLSQSPFITPIKTASEVQSLVSDHPSTMTGIQTMTIMSANQLIQQKTHHVLLGSQYKEQIQQIIREAVRENFQKMGEVIISSMSKD